LFAKDFAAFKACGGLIGTQCGDGKAAEVVSKTETEGEFGTDDGKVRAM
jgi:hypothetical protein